MNISFEIVPRSLAAFDEQYAFVEGLGAGVNMLNVPDIQRFDTRSWQVAQRIDRSKYRFVPHFRAIDFKSDGTELSRIIDAYQLDHILLVTGDPPEGLRTYYQTDVVSLIRVIAQRHPQLKIYAGFDPHRSGLQAEYQYIQRKIDAGAQGFFSQPFYDLRMVEVYAELLQNTESYLGLSPITSKASMNYWQVKNKVQFPQAFRPELDWNVDFAHQVIRFADEQALNVYFMPIKIDLIQYFGRLHISA